MVKKRDIVELEIKDTPSPNKSYAEIDGKKVVLKGGIKGQKVRARITRNTKEYYKAKIIDIVENSPLEMNSNCIYSNICGGCSYQSLPYEKQLKMKENQVRNLFKEEEININSFLQIEESPNKYEYRNKMEFTFGDEEKGGDLSLGLHKKGRFYDIVSVVNCNIVDEDFRKILYLILNYFKERQVEHYNKNSHIGVLRYLVVRKALSTGEILLNLVTSSQQKLELTELIEILKNEKLKGKIVGFLHTINDNISDAVKVDEIHLLYGRNYIIEKILGLSFKISPFSFFQTNTFGAEKLYSIVRDFAGNIKDKVIFDLYCGTGTISQIMSPLAQKVVGIEIVEEAVNMAKENAKLNGLDNCEFIVGDVLKEVDKLNAKPDLIILDPPREGIKPKAVKKIIHFNPQQFIYVSCNPVTLVRDLKEFVQKGYTVDKVKCMDMFPHTPHVETCVSLKK